MLPEVNVCINSVGRASVLTAMMLYSRSGINICARMTVKIKRQGLYQLLVPVNGRC